MAVMPYLRVWSVKYFLQWITVAHENIENFGATIIRGTIAIYVTRVSRG